MNKYNNVVNRLVSESSNGGRNYALLRTTTVYPVGSIMGSCPFEGNHGTTLIGIEIVSKGIYNIHLSYKDEGYTHQINQSDLYNIKDYDGNPIENMWVVNIYPIP